MTDEAHSMPDDESKSVAKPDVGTFRREARRTAAVILEVWGGLRTPVQAAEALAVSLTRYYHLEGYALDGMVQALEPRRRGVRSPNRELNERTRERDRLKRECARYQALVRTAQRTMGIRSVAPTPAKPTRGKRRRKPVVRALKLVAALGTHEAGIESGAS